MKYYIDTEFIEGFHKPLFGKRRHFIDLISIGIKCEDGREYYAISSEYNEKDADQWVKDNVIHPIFQEACNYPTGLLGFEKEFIKSNKQISEDVQAFVFPGLAKTESHSWDAEEMHAQYGNPEFYGYYADYDWVVFCSLFGRMIDLPKGFPMYCRDLKQMLDVKVRNAGCCVTADSFNEHLANCKNLPNYPKQTSEHNALDDARWNMELHKFLQQL